MREPPDLTGESLLAAVQAGWGLSARQIEFLPIGNDGSAWVFRAEGAGLDLFVKLRRGPVSRAGLLIPDALRRRGMPEVVAPLLALDGRCWAELGEYHLILYPYVEGQVGMQVGLSEAQWSALGGILHRLHTVRPADLPAQALRREDFRPSWAEMVRRLDARMGRGTVENPQQAALAQFWLPRRAQILEITARSEALGQQLRAAAPEMVLCHADIHTANVLVDASGGLHIVDWDGALLAPRERDLMFVLGDDRLPSERAFLQGYGEATLDPLPLAYYSCEWVVQELGDFGERIFFRGDLGEDVRVESLDGIVQLFTPGDVVEGAQRALQRLTE